MAIVSVQGVSKDYMLGKIVVPALRGVTLEVDRGEFISIAGPSGSGKTTLLNLIGCVDTATAGTVRGRRDRTPQLLTERQLTDLRLHTIGFIFQSFNLVSVLIVFQNVEFPLLLQGKLTRRRAEARVHGTARRRWGSASYAEAPAQRAVRRAAAARGGGARAGDQARRSCSPTSRPPTSTPRPGQHIIDLMKEMNQRDGHHLHLLDPRPQGDVARQRGRPHRRRPAGRTRGAERGGRGGGR